MKIPSFIACAAIGLFAFTAPSLAHAHSRVVSSTPAEGSAVAKPKTVTLTFSEALTPATTAASIVMTAMPGVKDHGEMLIRNFTAAWSNGNRTLTMTLRQPLHSGTYEVRWQSVGADGHRMNGKVGFTVK